MALSLYVREAASECELSFSGGRYESANKRSLKDRHGRKRNYNGSCWNSRANGSQSTRRLALCRAPTTT